MNDHALLDVRGLTKRLGRRAVVDDVSFTVPRGSITALVGRNGAGKSTVLRTLVGLARPDAGVVTFGGRDYRQLRLPARHVGTALDASAVHPGRTVRETIRLAAALAGATRVRGNECLRELGLADVDRTLVGALSLGMRQRLAIAVALLGHPPLLILDEPANGLDPEWRRWLDVFLRHHRDAGGAALVSSHELDWAEKTADAVVLLERGHVKYVGPARADSTETSFVSSDDGALTRSLQRAGLSARRVDGVLRVRARPRTVSALAQEDGILLDHLSREPGGALEALLLESEDPVGASASAVPDLGVDG